MEGLLREIRSAARHLIQTPQFTLPAIFGLGLGITISTFMFSIVNAYLFRPLPVKNGNDLVVLGAKKPTWDTLRNLSYLNFIDIRQRVTSFDDLIGYALVEPSMRADGFSARVNGEAVTGNYFEFLGIRPSLGREITAADDSMAAPSVAVLSHDLWTKRFASDPSVLGTTVHLNGSPFQIVGVAPEQFHGIDPVVRSDFWIAISSGPKAGAGGLENRDSNSFRIRGHLRAGVRPAQAQSELASLSRQSIEEHPVDNLGLTISLIPEKRARPFIDTKDQVPVAGFLLLGLATLVLINACGNITGLMLARSDARRREISVRRALGASHYRIVREILIEGVLVALAGGVIGCIAVRWATALVSSALPATFPVYIDILPDRTVFAFAFLIAATAGIGIGSIPAFDALHMDVQSGLKGESGPSGATRKSRARSRIVVSQFAMVTLLLVTASLFLQGLNNATNVDLGFKPDHRLVATLSPGDNGYTPERGRQIVENFVESVRTLPGVRSASIVYEPQLGFGNTSTEIRAISQPAAAERSRVYRNVIGPDYFETIGTPIVAGRSFDRRDTESATPVAVVNETFAKTYWPGQPVIGKRFALIEATGERVVEVAGVARDAKYNSINEPPTSYVFLPYTQEYVSDVAVVVHSEGAPALLVDPMRNALKAIDPTLGLLEPTTLEELISASALGSIRAGAGVFSVMGVLAFSMAILGMYSLLMYSARRRTREIGIRIAVGATSASIIGLFMRSGLRLALIGITMGLIAAYAVAHILRGFLLGVSDISALPFFSPVLLGLATITAAYFSGRQVLAANPVKALQQE